MSEPTRIYLATRGEFSDYRVCHAFTRREDAEAYQLGDDVLEMEVREGPVEVRYWYDLDWHADRPDHKGAWPVVANPYVHSELRDFDGDERRVEHTWSGDWLNVQGWDKQAVMKVYSEQRTQYLARQEGVS
jgi:hypothetical protein